MSSDEDQVNNKGKIILSRVEILCNISEWITAYIIEIDQLDNNIVWADNHQIKPRKGYPFITDVVQDVIDDLEKDQLQRLEKSNEAATIVNNEGKIVGTEAYLKRIADEEEELWENIAKEWEQSKSQIVWKNKQELLEKYPRERKEEFVEDNNLECKCSLDILMSKGCTCGVAKREKEKK